MLTPGVCSIADSSDVVALFSTRAGCITSRETVTSATLCSNRPADTTAMSRTFASVSREISQTTLSPSFRVKVFFAVAIPINEHDILCVPLGRVMVY